MYSKENNMDTKLYLIHSLTKLNDIEEMFITRAHVIMSDPGQLPPVGSNSLWIDISKNKNLLGYLLYLQFDDVIILEENNRLDISNSNTVKSDEFLNRLHNGNNDESDWNLLYKKYSYYSIGHAE